MSSRCAKAGRICRRSIYPGENGDCHTSRSTYSGQIAGVHTLELGTLDWDAGYSYADKNQPDRRIVNRQEKRHGGDAHYGQMQIDQNEIRRDFAKLREHIASAGINYSCTCAAVCRSPPN